MNKIHFFCCITLSVLLMTLFGACSNTKTVDANSVALAYIPVQSSAAAMVNLGDLMAKADVKTLQELPEYKAFQANEKEAAKFLDLLINNSSELGLDLAKPMAIAVDASSAMTTQKPIITGILPIGDKAAFLAKYADLQKLEKELVDFKEENGYSVAELSKEGRLVLTDEVLIFTNQATEAIQAIVAKEDAKLDNPLRDKLLNSTGDIRFAMSTNQVNPILDANAFMKSMVTGGLASVQLTPEALNDNYFDMSYEFLNGEVKTVASAKFSSEIEKMLGDVFANECKTDFSPYYPTENLVMAQTIALKTSEITKLLNTLGYAEIVDLTLSQENFNLKEIEGFLSGDMAMAVYLDAAKKPVVVATIGLNDTKITDKIVATMQKNGVSIKDNAGKYELDILANEFGIQKLFIEIKDNVLVLQSQADFINTAKGKSDLVKELQANFAGTYVDYSLLEKGVQNLGSLSQISQMQFETNSIKHLKSVAKKGVSTTTMTLKNSSENALKVIINDAIEANRNMKKELKKEFDAFDDAFEDAVVGANLRFALKYCTKKVPAHNE